LFTLTGLAAVLLVAGCGPNRIAKLNSKPQKYDGQEVTVVGRVIDTRDIPLTKNDYYKVTDDTGELWVLTTRGVALRGLKYKIKGTYRRPDGSVAGVLLGDYIVQEHKREEVRE